MVMSSARSWLTLLSLYALFNALFVAAALRFNGPDAFNPRVKSPYGLFAVGGVYGHSLGTENVILHTVTASVFGIAALAFCDLVYARHTQARWFGLHVVANLWITMFCIPDVAFMLADPLGALADGRTNHWPTSLVFSVHLYHMLFFSGLHWIDWLHHILMVVVGAPLLITGEMGPLMNFNNFFMCGLPGGLDYAMLYAVRSA